MSMFKTIIGSFFAIAAFNVHANNSITLNFDDLNPPAQGSRVPENYAGLYWGNFYVSNVNTITVDPDSYDLPNSGYKNGVITTPNVISTWATYGSSLYSQAPITVNSFYLTAAWTDNLRVVISSNSNISGNNYEYTVLRVSRNSPTLVELNWTGVTWMNIQGFVDGFDQFYSAALIDNFTYTLGGATIPPVPEPSTYAMIGLGLGLLGFASRSRKYY